MSLLEKVYTLLILASVSLGIFLGSFNYINQNIDMFIVPLLIAMLYLSFLQIPITEMKAAFKNRRFTLTTIVINFIWTPLFAWLLATIFLYDHPALIIGFLMLMVTPCTDWYLVFTGIARGNLAISTALLPINLLLQVVLLPVYLLLFTKTTGFIELSFLLNSIVFIIVVPFCLARISNYFLRRAPHFQENLFSNLSSFSIIFLCLAIVSMFASQGQLLFNNLELLFQLLLPILLFFFFTFIIGQKIGKKLAFSSRDRSSLTLVTLARNSPIALAIALTAFPNEPMIALTLIIGPLIELPILAITAQILLTLNK